MSGLGSGVRRLQNVAETPDAQELLFPEHASMARRHAAMGSTVIYILHARYSAPSGPMLYHYLGFGSGSFLSAPQIPQTKLVQPSML